LASIVVRAEFTQGRKKTTIRVLIDTGAEITIISADVAKKLGLKKDFSLLLRGAGGEAGIYMSKVGSAKIIGTSCTVKGLMVGVYDERAFPMGALTGMSGILGLDFMQRAKMNIMAAARTGIISCGSRMSDLAFASETS